MTKKKDELDQEPKGFEKGVNPYEQIARACFDIVEQLRRMADIMQNGPPAPDITTSQTPAPPAFTEEQIKYLESQGVVTSKNA